MGARLKKVGEEMHLKLGGYDEKDEFMEALERAKNITPRRYDAERKLWVYPHDLTVLQRVVHALEPDLDAELLSDIRSAGAQVAEELQTNVGDDSALLFPAGDGFFPYQRAAVDFMAEHPHTILADEMGLGKTIESIAAVLERRLRIDPEELSLRHVFADWALAPFGLVIAPNSSLYGWERTLRVGPVGELRLPLWEDWPEQRATVIDGSSADRQVKQIKEAAALGTGWIIVNWEKLRTTKVGPALAKLEFDAIIADEAHRAKNRTAAQTKALYKLKAPVQYALTGTPVMNHPGDLWSLLHWLRPEQYTSYWAFHNEYCEDHPGYKGKRVVTGVRNVDGLRFELADKLVRRTDKVLPDLPALRPPEFVTVELGAKQRALYKSAQDDLWLAVENALEDPRGGEGSRDSIVRAIEAGDAQALQYLIPNGAARVQRLRQIRTSPALLGGPDDSAPLDAAVELIRDGDPARQFVVFAWYREACELLVERLNRQKPSIDAVAYHGGVDPKDRPELVDQFQAGDIRVLAMTIKTGGEAIDLFAADTAIFLERDWVPATNRQAVKRLHRQGQQRPVNEVIIEARDTIDDGTLTEKNKLKSLMTTAILGS